MMLPWQSLAAPSATRAPAPACPHARLTAALAEYTPPASARFSAAPLKYLSRDALAASVHRQRLAATESSTRACARAGARAQRRQRTSPPPRRGSGARRGPHAGPACMRTPASRPRRGRRRAARACERVRCGSARARTSSTAPRSPAAAPRSASKNARSSSGAQVLGFRGRPGAPSPAAAPASPAGGCRHGQHPCAAARRGAGGVAGGRR